MRSWDMPWQTREGVTKLRSNTWVVTGRLRQRGRLAAGEAAYVRSLVSVPVKVTLIAPGFLADRFWQDGVTGQVYASREELAAEVAAITRAEIETLIAEGVSYIQLDNPGYGRFVGADAHGDQADFERMVNTDAAAVAGVERPAGVTIGLHVCRGNQSSMWMSAGGYEPIAERLFTTVPVDRFLLEYDDDRAGGFEPLRFVPDGTIAVLGLVTSKSPVLEPADGAAAAHGRGSGARRPGQPGAEPAVRLRLDRRGRQPPDRAGAVRQASPGGRHRPRDLGVSITPSRG